jgi:2-haloalkanoic acid dehalogenase type II
MKPVLITFDVFGTIVDWRRGLQADLAEAGCPCSDVLFEKILTAQNALEAGSYRTYREITAASLIEAAGLNADAADRIGQRVGHWPLYPDVRQALQRMMKLVPCIAMTNSDRIHGKQVQEQLGFNLSDWICAEETRVYKPDPAFWRTVATWLHFEFGRSWWHASAYMDFDLKTAGDLGLSTVFVFRDHSVFGKAGFVVKDLNGLAAIVETMSAMTK